MQVKSKIPTETDLKPASGLYGLDLKVLIYGLSEGRFLIQVKKTVKSQGF
jgi:hypothetical protein